MIFELVESYLMICEFFFMYLEIYVGNNLIR